MAEAKEFIKYFVGKLTAMGIPWTLNALEIYYDSKACHWYMGPHEHVGMHFTQTLIWNEVRKSFFLSTLVLSSDQFTGSLCSDPRKIKQFLILQGA